MKKPTPLKNWPSGYMYLARDESGDYWFHEGRPEPLIDKWSCDGRMMYAGNIIFPALDEKPWMKACIDRISWELHIAK
jgi:hypothetical protein